MGIGFVSDRESARRPQSPAPGRPSVPPVGCDARFGETARYFLGRPRSVLSPGDVLVHLQGDPIQLAAALRYLAGAGFLIEERFRFDFAGTLLYRYRLAPDLSPFSDNLLA